jgi:hypothetical protein
MKVGEFEIEVWSPYPCHISIRYRNDKEELRFSHKDLADIEYAIKWAKHQARLLLKNNANEVM